MPLILPANTLADTGFSVANSCRFDQAGTASMSWTQGTVTSTKIGTISFWIKRSQLSDDMQVIGQTTSNYFRLYIKSNNAIRFYSNQHDFTTTRVFRDTNAWMHICCVWDTTQGTEANRMKMYINGTQETAFTTQTYPAEDDVMSFFVSSQPINIGKHSGNYDYGDYYLAEVVCLDGTAAAITDFGEFDEDSPTIWKPKDVSGLTFGNNGFYLDFEDSGDLGDDESGNTNDFTETNLAAADQAVDSPTNNFCTMNPLDNYIAGMTFSEGNCRVVTLLAEAEAWTTGTFGMSAGKWYFEAKLTAATLDPVSGNLADGLIGVSGRMAIAAGELGHFADTFGWNGSGGGIRNSDSTNSYGDAYAVGDIIGVEFNIDDGELKFYKNGTVENSGTAFDMSATPSTGFYFPAVADWATNLTQTWDFNFGGCSAFAISSAASDENGYGNFEYEPASGFLAICTKNLGSDGG